MPVRALARLPVLWALPQLLLVRLVQLALALAMAITMSTLKIGLPVLSRRLHVLLALQDLQLHDRLLSAAPEPQGDGCRPWGHVQVLWHRPPRVFRRRKWRTRSESRMLLLPVPTVTTKQTPMPRRWRFCPSSEAYRARCPPQTLFGSYS